MIARLTRALAIALLRRMRVGSLFVAEPHARTRFGAGAPEATLEVHSPRFWAYLLRGSRGLADSYERGLWDSPDLVSLIRLGAVNSPALDRARERLSRALAPVRATRSLVPERTRERRRRDVAAHYDLGEELFERMLDPTLSYSCAIFDDAQASLEEAQLAKLERVCEKLDLGPRDRVLEIGTGWGSFAVHAAATRGCHVTTTTISRRQYDYARRRVLREGLSDRVTVLMQDYADLRGSYDKLVSIEMIEAVGWRAFGRFFSKCSSLLVPDGAMLLQAITIDDRAYEVEKDAPSFINTRIFPGGCLPSLEVIASTLARRTDMQLLDLEDITSHYVETLRRWRSNLLGSSAPLDELGYGERFRRLWTLYLAYCEAGFSERRICDVQLLLGKPRWRGGDELPRLRSAPLQAAA